MTNCPPSLGLLEHELGHERPSGGAAESQMKERKAKNNCPNAHAHCLNSNALQSEEGPPPMLVMMMGKICVNKHREQASFQFVP